MLLLPAQKAQTGALSSRQALPTWRVPGNLGLKRNTLSQKTKTNTPKTWNVTETLNKLRAKKHVIQLKTKFSIEGM